jgi:hypothetical protein
MDPPYHPRICGKFLEKTQSRENGVHLDLEEVGRDSADGP